MKTKDGKVELWLTSVIEAEWDTDHYDFTITGEELGLVKLTGNFLRQYQGEITVENGEVTLDDAIVMTILGCDTADRGIVCKIDSTDI